MELQHKQIEAIADNVQTVLNNELQSISKYKELENKFNNLFDDTVIISGLTINLFIIASNSSIGIFKANAKQKKEPIEVPAAFLICLSKS